MQPIRMVVTDLDGTLLTRDKRVTERAMKAIRAIRDKGVKFVFATARPVRGVRQLYPELPCDAGIFHNGAVVHDSKGVVAEVGIERPQAVLLPILRAFPAAHICAEANDRLYANFDPDSIWRGIDYVPTEDFACIGDIADKLIIEAHSIAEMERYAPFLPEELYMQLSEFVIAMIMNIRATKENAVRLLAERWGIPLENVAAFGDDFNDIGILRACGTGVAMGNALDEVKRAADFVCGSNEEDGVATWLEAHVL